MSHALYRRLSAAAVLLAALFVDGCQKQEPAADAAVPTAQKPAATVPPARAADAAPPLSPSEEKKLIDLAKSRKAADGATVWEVIQNAQQQRPEKFKVSTVDLEYKKDGLPGAVQVCYWIGKKRLEEDQSCQSLAWEVAADRSLSPFVTAQAQAVETGKAAFLQLVDQMYDKKCGGGGKDLKAC